MAAPLATWVAMSGVQLQAGGALDVSLRATTTLFDADGIASVRLTVTKVGVGVVTSETSTRESLRRPNFSSQPSRMPGAPAGTMAPFPGYGINIDAGIYPAGELQVTATITARSGSVRTMPAITIYNRVAAPCSRVVYLDFDAGDDANDGSSWAQAVRTIRRAQILVRVNPAGSTLADFEAGGGRIICRGTAHGGSASGAIGIHTSGQWWLSIEADPVIGCRWGRSVEGSYSPGVDNIYAGVPGNAANCSIRFVGIDWVGIGPVVFLQANTTMRAWVDGGTQRSAYYLGPEQWSVRYRDDDGPCISYDGNGAAIAAAKTYVTGQLKAGCSAGIAGVTMLYDCEIREFLGIAMQIVGSEAPSAYTCVLQRNQSYVPGVVAGYVRCEGTPSGFPCPALVVTVPSAGVMRITRSGSGRDFAADTAGMIGSLYWGLRCTGLPAGCNGTWSVLATGSASGSPYVDVACATASAGIVTAGAATLATAQLSGPYLYWDIIHPDGLQIFGTRPGDDVVLDVAAVNTPAMQFLFTSGYDQLRLWIENCGESSGLVCNFADASFIDCVIRRVSIAGSIQFGNILAAESLSFAKTEVRNCVFGSMNSGAAAMVALGAVVDSCHFVSGGAVGDNATTGPWYATNPTLPPYSLAPLATRKGTGSSRMVDPPEWAWQVSPPASTRGVLRNVSELDWSIGGVAGVVVTPSPSSVAMRSTDPSVLQGPVVVAPAASRVGLRTTDPGVVLGPVVMSPAASQLRGATTDPVVLFGAVVVAPAASRVAVASTDPVVLFGAVTVTPAAARVAVRTNDPSILNGALTVVPAPSRLAAVTADPISLQGPVSVAPAASQVAMRCADPATVLGAVSVAPGASISAWRTADPLVSFGALVVVPGASVVALATGDPALNAPPLIVTPEPAAFVMETAGPYFAVPAVASTGFGRGEREQKDGLFRWRE